MARERQAKITYRSVEEIVTGYLKRVAVEGKFSIEPRFEEKEEFVIAGYRKHTRDGFHVIGESWFELKSSLNTIERKNEHTMYGFEDYSEEFCSKPLSFYYMAGVEVEIDTPLPEGMYRKVVPKVEYAVFTVNGNNLNGEIGKVLQYIYFVWLPNSEYCIDENALFDFEYYDERWDCKFGAAQMDIYVPIRRIPGLVMAFCDLFKEFIPIRVDEDIYLRQHEPEKDARPFWEIYYDEENFTWFGGYRRPRDWDEEREIQAEASRVKGFKGKREYSWVVTYQGEVIGQIQLFNFFNHNTCAEVGYFIKKTYWNRGINTKVLKAVCRFGIETMGLERMEAFAHVDNIGSNRTLQKAGFDNIIL